MPLSFASAVGRAHRFMANALLTIIIVSGIVLEAVLIRSVWKETLAPMWRRAWNRECERCERVRVLDHADANCLPE